MLLFFLVDVVPLSNLRKQRKAELHTRYIWNFAFVYTLVKKKKSRNKGNLNERSCKWSRNSAYCRSCFEIVSSTRTWFAIRLYRCGSTITNANYVFTYSHLKHFDEEQSWSEKQALNIHIIDRDRTLHCGRIFQMRLKANKFERRNRSSTIARRTERRGWKEPKRKDRETPGRIRP